LRPKQSPIRQGDGFTSYAITKYGHDLQDKQDCFYGAAVELPLAVIARERSLRPKQSPIRQGDGFVSLTMTGTARCHCEERPLRPKQSPIRQGDGFASHAMTEYGQDLQDKQDCFYGAAVVLSLTIIARERSLRRKQSPIRRGDGFTEFTGSAVKMLIMMIDSYNTVAIAPDS